MQDKSLVTEQKKIDKKMKIIAIVVGIYAVIILIGQFGKQSTPSNTVVDGSTSTIQKNAPSPTHIPTVAPKPIKISFTGKIEPSVLHPGEKAVLTFEVINEDAQRPLEGLRILFADSGLISKGLTIVNVMSGGICDGRAFEWKNELMKIPPGSKRDFVIVAQANEPGSYESVVTLVNPMGVAPFDDQGQELNAKLLVY